MIRKSGHRFSEKIMLKHDKLSVVAFRRNAGTRRMKRILSIMALLAALGGLPTNMVSAQETRLVELSAPRMPAVGESLEVQVATGPLPAGAKVVVMTEQGEVLGAVVPYALPGKGKDSVGTVAVPSTALVDRRLRLQLQVVQQGKPPRAPGADEVRRVNLVLSTRQ